MNQTPTKTKVGLIDQALTAPFYLHKVDLINQAPTAKNNQRWA